MSKWQRCTDALPCPICGRKQHCSVSTDGLLAACMRVEEGSFKAKHQSDGQTCYIHRLSGERDDWSPPPPEKPAQFVEDIDLNNRVYKALWRRLSLSDEHRAAMEARGLSGEDLRFYRSYPMPKRGAIAGGIRREFGDVVMQVPGFSMIPKKDGGEFFGLAGRTGMLIPVLDLQGRIRSVRIRRDDNESGPKYSYLSSTKYDGPGAAVCAHVPHGVGSIRGPTVLYVVEGELKADVAWHRFKLPTIAIPGIGSWACARDVFAELAPAQVVIVPDADIRSNRDVAAAVNSFIASLRTDSACKLA